MNRSRLLSSLLIAPALLLASAGLAQDISFPGEETGQDLAAELRSLGPSEDFQVTGTFRIDMPDQAMLSVPVTNTVLVGDSAWRAVYRTGPAGKRGEEQLTVVHRPERPNLYIYSKAPAPGQTLGEPKILSGADAEIPLGGSDFWLTDLGLEFVHWPNQEISKRGIMRKGRPVRVLESRPPAGAKSRYGRVVSYVDNENKGIILAEAYDREDHLLKKFKVDSLKKVNGEWRLRAVEMRNVQTGSETRLEFDLTPDEAPED